MNSRCKGKKISTALLAVLFVLAVAAFAMADDKKQSHPSAPAQHSAPAAHPSAPAQHPGGGPGGASHPGGVQNNTNRPGGNQPGNRPGGNQPGNRQGGNQPGNRPGGNQPGNRPGGAAANNHQPTGSKSVALKNGGSASFRQNGQLRSVQAHGVTVSRGLNGQRNIVATHNGRTVVSAGRNGGYTQRAYYRRGNTVYVQRTYVYGGRTYAYAYRSYYWGGYPYYGYAPGYYWGPAYYGWAYNPWPAPVYYGWGWGAAPWYGYYGPYWAPYPVYPSAAFWLTDFFVGASLQAAYAAQAQAAAENGELTPPQFKKESSDVIASLWSSDPLVAANLASTYGANPYLLGAAAPAASSGPAMTKEIKDAIADEIKDQIAGEKDAAANSNNSSSTASGPPAALDPKIRYFVVSTDLDLTTSDGTECTLTGGDVVYRTGDQPDGDKMVDATVKSSKKGECPIGSTVGVATTDLQEMYNNLRQNMSDGMKEMANNSGKNGLPTAPDTKTTAGEVPAPTADTNVKDDLQQAQKDGDQVEAEAKQPNN